MKLLFNVNVAWFLLSHRLEVARAARDSGFEIHVSGSAESGREIAQFEQEGFCFHRTRVARKSLSVAHDLTYLADVYDVIKHVRPDIVHNITIKPIIFGTIAARRLRVPCIVNAVSGLGYAFSNAGSRGLLSRLVKVAYRVALSRPDIRVIFQNEADVAALVKSRVVSRTQAVLIRGSGVDLEAFAVTPEPEGTPVVLLPARMLKDKGVLEFGVAARMVRARGLSADFLLAGKIDEGNPSSLTREEIQELERKMGVRWIGHVENMPALLARVHIVCLPSYREGLPKSLIEACAAGRPIVSTKVPGCRDVVRDGENGLLVETKNPEELAAAISKLLLDAGLRRRMGTAGRRIAESEFDVRAVVRSTLRVYEQMLG